MKKFVFALLSAFVVLTAAAQDKKNKDWKNEVLDRAGDHLMIQLTYDTWLNTPDSIKRHMKGLSRGFGVSFMMDKPFKSDPRWSIAFGLGVNGSNIFFKNMEVDVNALGTKLPFRNLDSADRFKKYKLVNVYAEIPIELRYTFNPTNDKKSWKIAIGGKLGTMLKTYTKGKTLQDKNGRTLNGYTEKVSKRNFFNGTRLMATARVGYGNFSLVCNYQFNALIKDGSGPGVNPLQIGLCVSGL
jgi:hypothetical protein